MSTEPDIDRIIENRQKGLQLPQTRKCAPSHVGEGHRVAACNTKGSCQKQAVMDDIILDRTGEYRRRWAVKGCEPSK
ncbi:hypothetical protein D917_01640, partial [Trichinella nativa]